MGNPISKESLALHEDTFYEYFVPYRHPDAQSNVWGGHGLETYGADFQLVRSLQGTFIWTVVDGSDDSNQWIIPGIHHINRICYLVTEKPHNWLDVEFLIPNRMRSLTPLGLTRQLRKLERAIASHSLAITLNRET